MEERVYITLRNISAFTQRKQPIRASSFNDKAQLHYMREVIYYFTGDLKSIYSYGNTKQYCALKNTHAIMYAGNHLQSSRKIIRIRHDIFEKATCKQDGSLDLQCTCWLDIVEIICWRAVIINHVNRTCANVLETVLRRRQSMGFTTFCEPKHRQIVGSRTKFHKVDLARKSWALSLLVALCNIRGLKCQMTTHKRKSSRYGIRTKDFLDDTNKYMREIGFGGTFPVQNW